MVHKAWPRLALPNSPASLCSINVLTLSPSFLDAPLCLFHQHPLPQTPPAVAPSPASGQPPTKVNPSHPVLSFPFVALSTMWNCCT